MFQLGSKLKKMKRSHAEFESGTIDFEKQKQAKAEGKSYIEHGGRFDGSMKSSLFQHNMEITEDMFQIPNVYGFKSYFLCFKTIKTDKNRLNLS